jgi:hypothetical protein
MKSLEPSTPTKRDEQDSDMSDSQQNINPVNTTNPMINARNDIPRIPKLVNLHFIWN